MRGLFGMGGLANMAEPTQRMAPDPTRMLMDVGTTAPHTYSLLQVYDSQGEIANSINYGYPSTSFSPPAGAVRAVIRVGGPGGGGTGSDTGFGSNPRTIHTPGGSGGAWAKTTLYTVQPNDYYSPVNSWNNISGYGIAVNNTVVCFAQAGSFSAQDSYHAGGSASQSLGDVTRSGGAGTSSGGGQGGDGDHGAVGSQGGYETDGPNPPFTNQVDYNYYGGSGGQGGDYGDPDGVGFGWNYRTGERYTASSFSNATRFTVHFYGY